MTAQMGAKVARHLRVAMRSHTNDPNTGQCRHCGVRDCSTFRMARAQLVLAGLEPQPPMTCIGHEHSGGRG